MKRLKEIKQEIKSLKLERELLRNKKEHHLITKARKRGFYEGMEEPFLCLMDSKIWDCRNEFNISFNGDLGLGSSFIFYKGKWATIIK